MAGCAFANFVTPPETMYTRRPAGTLRARGVGVASPSDPFPCFDRATTNNPSGRPSRVVFLALTEPTARRWWRQLQVDPCTILSVMSSRRFARLSSGAAPLRAGQSPVPTDGMCLNCFLVLMAPDDPRRVLLGRIAPDPRWDALGGLDPGRASRVGNRWMLPSSQLLLFESPDEAAHRLGTELLGIDLPTLEGPRVFSDTYRRADSAGEDPHWDVQFVFTGRGPLGPPTHPLWRELAYVPVHETPRAEFARNQGDVLELVGFPPRDVSGVR